MLDHGPGDVRFFDRVAPLYDRLMPAARTRPFADAFAFARRPVESVLDLAGGTGRAARTLESVVASDSTADGQVVVVDRSLGMLQVARSRGHECVAADAGALPVADDTVDAVTVVDALHHIPDQRSLVQEAERVLAPGGVLVISDFNPDTLRGRALVAAEHLVGFDSVFSTPDDLARFLEREGLESRLVDGGFGYVVAGRADG